MKLTTALILNNQSNQCQFAIEVNLNDDAEMDEIQEKTNKATAALKIAVNSVINIKALNNAPAAKAPKQLPTDQASPGQIKYLKDLTNKNGTNLKAWCKDHGVSPDNITGAHCKEWIPELLEKSKTNIKEDDKFFLN